MTYAMLPAVLAQMTDVLVFVLVAGTYTRSLFSST
jgi:hypothetical protein